MAVSVLLRPYGYIRNGSFISAQAAQQFGSRVLISRNAHGLTDNYVIYFISPVEQYNGWKKVDVENSGQFTLKKLDDTYVSFIRSLTSDIGYYITKEISGFTAPHTWNCVHLPIVYKISNTLWPTNSVDTVRTISSVTDSNGYCAIVSSGNMTAAVATIAALDSVIITNSTDDDLNGVWQCIAATNDTTFTINIPYSAANDTALTGASIHFYYNNYVTKVQVWGGLNNGHTYYAQKPYELLATLDLIPDEDNVCKFSVSEILRKQISVENNLLLGTLPNNLDAWTGFFIKYGEEYDISDGTTLSRQPVSYTSDLASFEGKAVNSILPFKNIYSGFMSEYVSGDANQKFLTNWLIPTIFPGWYFALGYIFSGSNIVLNTVSNGVSTLTEIENSDEGVYRIPITASCDQSTIEVSILGDIYSGNSEGLLLPSAWTDGGAIGMLAYEAKTATYFEAIETGSGGYQERGAYQAKTVANGVIFTFYVRIVIDVTGTNPLQTIEIHGWLNDAITIAGATDVDVLSFPAEDGDFIREISITSTKSNTHLFLFAILSGLNTGTANVRIYPLSSISETKTLNVNCDCVPTQSEEGIYLSWQNNLGDFDYWLFTANKDHIIDITDSGETEENTFPEWPNSYGEFADTANRRQTFRTSTTQVLVRSQNLSANDLEMIKAIKSSPLVQIVNSIYDRRTVIVDTDSFVWKQEGQSQKDPYKISFTITYTDDVPSQKV